MSPKLRFVSCGVLGLAGMMAALAPATAAEKLAKLAGQYPGIEIVQASRRGSCAQADLKRPDMHSYNVLGAPAPDGGLPLRGIGYSKGFQPQFDAQDILLPLAKQEIHGGGNGCLYLVRPQGQATYDLYRIDEQRKLVKLRGTPYTQRQAPEPMIVGLFVMVRGGDAEQGYDVDVLGWNSGELAASLTGVQPDAAGRFVFQTQTGEWRTTIDGGRDFDTQYLYAAHTDGTLSILTLAPRARFGNEKLLHRVGESAGTFWLGMLLVDVEATAEGSRYRLRSGGLDLNPPEALLAARFSRLRLLTPEDAAGYIEVENTPDAIRRLQPLVMPSRSRRPRFAAEIVHADGHRSWQIMTTGEKYQTYSAALDARTWTSLRAVMAPAVHASGDAPHYAAQDASGQWQLLDTGLAPSQDMQAASIADIIDTVYAKRAADAALGQQQRAEQAASLERIRRAEAMYEGQRAQEAARIRVIEQHAAAEAQAQRERSEAFSSITDSLVKGVGSSGPSGPPRGVNQGVYDDRYDSTGAGYDSYRKAVEREAERKAKCTGANC